MRMSAVVAMAENRVIGKEQGLPWTLSGDMAHFRRVTRGKPLVMGRKTWDSLPKRPLPGRPNLVVTRNPACVAPGADVFLSLESALARARLLAETLGAEEVVIMGGAGIYAATLSRLSRIYLTEVHASPDGDVCFPAFSRTVWRERGRERHKAGTGDSADYSFVILERD